VPKDRKKSKGSTQKLTVSRVGSALEDSKKIPPKLRPALVRVVDRLAREGCRAADYALSGDPPWPHLCAKHFDGWRVIVAFPTLDEVVILKIARHDRAHDPYREIADELGVPVSTARRTKPPCCDPAGVPPVDQEILERLEGAFSKLSRPQRAD
jgi:hypothetical protein